MLVDDANAVGTSEIRPRRLTRAFRRPTAHARAIRTSVGPLALAYASVLSLLAVVLLAKLAGVVSITELVRDPAVLSDRPAYSSLLSQLGLFGWTAATAVCLLAWRVLRATSARRAAPFAAIAALTAALGLDDAFLLHESDGSRYEAVFFAVYAGAALAIWLRFRRDTLVRRAQIMLLPAICLLALSVGVDVVIPATSAAQALLEDGLKLLGIVGLAAALAACTAEELRSARGPVPAAAGDQIASVGR